jgi:hypothetical protein
MTDALRIDDTSADSTCHACVSVQQLLYPLNAALAIACSCESLQNGSHNALTDSDFVSAVLMLRLLCTQRYCCDYYRVVRALQVLTSLQRQAKSSE